MFKFRQIKTRVSSPFDNDKSHDSTTTKLVKGGDSRLESVGKVLSTVFSFTLFQELWFCTMLFENLLGFFVEDGVKGAWWLLRFNTQVDFQ